LSQNLNEHLRLSSNYVMAKPIAPDYGQQFLLPPALEDWVPANHPARFLREFVDQLDLGSLGFVIPASLEGRPPYAPGLLLKIWLFGYMQRIRSTRKLEVACREQISLIWLTAMIQPDHNSLWRFWRDNKKALRAVFKRSVQLATEAGLVGLVLQALDGTKIQAAASGQTGWTKQRLEQLLKALDSELDEAESQIEKEGEPEPQNAYRLPESLTDKQALRETVRAGLQQMEQIDREHLHPKEPEARRMSCDGKNRFGYNAQALADDKAGVVVAAEVYKQENDLGLAVPLVKQAEQNCGSQAAVIVADGGYGSGADIQQAAENQINLLVRSQGDAVAETKPYHAHHFQYEPLRQSVTCPQGKELTFARQGRQKGQSVRVYRCQVKDCPVRGACTQEQRGRRLIEIWPHTAAVQRMRARLKEPGAEVSLRKRREVIERLFGQIKQHEGFRRWTVRGLEGVNTQWALICCAINLRTLFKNWRPGRV
jgi:transposase